MWVLLAALFDFIKGLFGTFVKSAVSLGYKYPILIAYIGIVSVLSVAFYSAIEILLSGLSLVFPNQYLALINPFIPGNLQSCFSVVLSCRLILLSLNWAFKFREKFWQMANDSTNVKF